MIHPTPHLRTTKQPPIFQKRSTAARAIVSTLLFFLTIGALALGLFAHQAVAEELAPSAPGSISGVVKNMNGELRTDITVTLYQLDRYDTTAWRARRAVATQANGSYRFTFLPTGLYRVGAYDAQRVYAPAYYPTAPVIHQGQDIAVAGDQRQHIDVTLQLAGQITGVITLSDGMTMTYGLVELRQGVERAAGTVWEVAQTMPVVATHGVYSFTGLAAIPYRVCATAAYETLAATECYDNVYDIQAATSLTPTAGATISNVNLLLGDGADYGQLQGQVTTPANEPLPQIEVYAMLMTGNGSTALTQPLSPAPPTIGTAPNASTHALYTPNPSYFAQSDATGHYHFAALAEGSYRLYFVDPVGNYAFAYYPDVSLPETATAINIAKGAVITNVNIQLEPASHLQGLLTVLGQPAPDATVKAELKSDWGWHEMPGAMVDHNSGHYTIRGLPAGIYRVTASTVLSDGYTSYFYQGYTGGNTLETAGIDLGIGITKSADITLTGGPRFEGSIAGRVTANGAPLAGAKVGLYAGGFICCTFVLPEPLVYVFTDAQGRYAMQGLAQNFYEVGVTDPVGIYATTYYTAQAVPSLANMLAIMDDKPLTAIDVDLPSGGAISGQVTKQTGQPVAGLRVMLYAPSQFSMPMGSTPIFGAPRPVATQVKTDATGRYTLKGLHAGEYYLCFQDIYNNRECYGAPSGNDSIHGTLVQVQPGATKANIDLLWGPDLHTYLPIAAK